MNRIRQAKKVANAIELYLGYLHRRVAEGRTQLVDLNSASTDFEVMGLPEFECDDNWLVPARLTPVDLGERVRIGIISPSSDTGWFQMTRIIQVEPREVRGQVMFVAPFMFRFGMKMAHVDREQLAEGFSTILGWFGNDRWGELSTGFEGRNFASVTNKHDPAAFYYGPNMTVARRFGLVRQLDSQFLDIVRLSLGFQFARNYYWTLVIGNTDGCKLRIPTDATGIDAFLNVRDKTGDRRTMLSHWVEEHWRQLRSDPEMETVVRRHLRGREEFTWGKWSGVIVPSVFDIDSVEIAREIRELRRQQKTDRRLRTSDDFRDSERERLREMRVIEAHKVFRHQLSLIRTENEAEFEFPVELEAVNRLAD